MLATLLLAGIVAAPLGSAGLFVRAGKRAHVAGAWAAARRFALALLGTVVLAAAAAGVLRLLHATEHNLVAGVAGLVAASLIWLPVTRRWNARAHLCWSSSVFLFVVYLVFTLRWTFESHLGPVSTAGGVLLWVLEVFAALLSCAYLWEICDALGTENWRRRITRTAPLHDVAERELPFVSLHVPAHNEPPDMVIETLRHLVRLDYPRYEVILIDDNTDDEKLWRPVEAWCAGHGVKFAHLADWPGYKSGALNYALRELTDEAAEVIGVVDSDYQIEPGFLRGCAPAFAQPWVGFIQAPQDYRDWETAPYYRRLYYSYKYFFAISQPSRNEHDGAIFAGTMGLIRRVALEQLGGWDEWCITEDAELSLRLLRAGWHGLHMDQTWGRGIMPLTFEGLKGQRYRWCFGGIQILRMHWRSLVPGRQSRENHLTTAQRWAYLAGGVQWYGDLLGLIFLVFLLAGAMNLAAGGGELFRKLTPFLVATVPVLVGLGLVRAVALLRRGTGASWRDALGAFFIWQSTSLVVAPFNSWAAQRATLPAWLRERRQTEYRRDRRAFAAGAAATGGVVAVLGVVAAAMVLFLAPGGGRVHTPDLVGPAQGQTPAPASTPSGSATATPAASASTSPGASPAGTPSAAPSSASPSPSAPVTSTPTPTPTPTSTPPPSATATATP